MSEGDLQGLKVRILNRRHYYVPPLRRLFVALQDQAIRRKWLLQKKSLLQGRQDFAQGGSLKATLGLPWLWMMGGSGAFRPAEHRLQSQNRIRLETWDFRGRN